MQALSKVVSQTVNVHVGQGRFGNARLGSIAQGRPFFSLLFSSHHRSNAAILVPYRPGLVSDGSESISRAGRSEYAKVPLMAPSRCRC